ncbi:MAG TPA: DUF3747 domain-containing protein [Synechococcales cyanobacterium M55_K2018_004]|nr:DUF3747 domain-containing protein [Synechococcales cyanobacterium M55_K2018_004]
MKVSFRRVAAAAAMLGAIAIGLPTHATVFGQREVDQSKYIAIAVPRSGNLFSLIILEQIAASPQCWAESGSNPVIVDPLLVNFDFTGICGRATDSNGYSIRANGRDLGMRYSLRLVPRNGELFLMGMPNDNALPRLEIGRANGLSTTSPVRIMLNPGWRFTRRTLENRVLGHVYVTYEGTLPPGVLPNITFADTATDTYADEIQQAVTIGFVSGFAEDNTFRPTQPLTREQLVSMVLDSLGRLPGVTLNVPNQTGTAPYRDVAANRWSAAKIAFARERGIVSGYEDGTFRPTQPVTRAELIAVLRRAAQFGQTLVGKSQELRPTQSPTTFSDAAGHWSAALLTEMSAYCNVASPVNERGTAFSPNSPAQRNYAAAATLRTFNCIQTDLAPSATAAPTPMGTAATPAP